MIVLIRVKYFHLKKIINIEKSAIEAMQKSTAAMENSTAVMKKSLENQEIMVKYIYNHIKMQEEEAKKKKEEEAKKK